MRKEERAEDRERLGKDRKDKGGFQGGGGDGSGVWAVPNLSSRPAEVTKPVLTAGLKTVGREGAGGERGQQLGGLQSRLSPSH